MNNVRYFIYELDSLGDFKNRIQIAGTPFTLKIKVIKKIADKIYAFGFNGNVLGSPFAALCFDTTGKQLWYKVYTNKRVYPTGSAITTDGHFIIGGVQTVLGDLGNGIRDSTFAWFAKIDTLGNIIWEKKIENKYQLPVLNVNVISINSKYYWFGGGSGSQKDLTIRAFADLTVTNEKGEIIQYTKTLQGIASKFYSTGTYIGYPIYKNGFLYGLGQASDTMSYAKYNDYIQFCKLDTLGNIKWRRTFSQWYMSNRPYSLTAVNDGFIICADGKDTTHTTGFTDAWIIKTDTNGCIIPGCHLLDGITEVLDAGNYAKVYPNPASSQITIEFIDPKQTKIDFIELIDEKGISLQTQQVNNQTFTLSTAHLPNGMYYLAAYFNGNKRVVKKVLVQHE
ncbi:MAG: T9SS type A sorting domain-containing protein [bacterium]|nr:T9SS type A sorting domain-containing protein [bacterium]